MAKLLDGKKVNAHVLQTVQDQMSSYEGKEKPGLAVILVGDNPASKVYVSRKKKACEALGIVSFEYCFPDSISQKELATFIQHLNQDSKVNGILLQLPLPPQLNSDDLLPLIDPAKDVDGFHPVNVGKLLLGLPALRSCTPAGICELLTYYEIPTEGAHVVIVGRSNIVGKPLAAMLMQRDDRANATVTMCHSRTKNMAEMTKSADILIAAIGKPNFITADMVKPEAVVIDVGINRIDDATREKGYRLVGDVDFDAVEKKVSAITPVPGGVGPMTIAMLMKNTFQAFLAQNA